MKNINKAKSFISKKNNEIAQTPAVLRKERTINTNIRTKKKKINIETAHT